jgi:predicted kinase
MAAALDDEGLLRLIDFYKCYRAYVRGKVESLQSLGASEDPKTKSRTHAKRYFQLALQYAVCGSEPMVLVVMGRIASGKSTLAKSLGRELGWEVVSSDRLRKHLAGMPARRRGTSAERQRLYAEGMTQRTYEALLKKAAEHVRNHCSVILDATFGRRRHRDRLRSVLRRRRATFCFVEAQAPDSIVMRRLEGREGKVAEISDARLEDFEVLSGGYEPPSELSERELLVVSTRKAAEMTIVETLEALARFTRKATL